MSIVKDFEKLVIKRSKTLILTDKQFAEISGFVNDMKKSGLIKKNNYTLSPLDTIGKRLNETFWAIRKNK